MADLPARRIVWESTGDGEFPYAAVVRDARLTVRVNDFPAEPLYTLFVDGRAAYDLEDWPAEWVRPAATPERLRIGGDRQLRRGRVDAIVVADWAHRFCAAPPGPASAVLAALGLTALGLTASDRVECVEEDGVVTALILHLAGDRIEPLETRVTVDAAPFVCEIEVVAAEPAGPATSLRFRRRPGPQPDTSVDKR